MSRWNLGKTRRICLLKTEGVDSGSHDEARWKTKKKSGKRTTRDLTRCVGRPSKFILVIMSLVRVTERRVGGTCWYTHGSRDLLLESQPNVYSLTRSCDNFTSKTRLSYVMLVHANIHLISPDCLYV